MPIAEATMSIILSLEKCISGLGISGRDEESSEDDSKDNIRRMLVAGQE